jgi:peptide deformylase
MSRQTREEILDDKIKYDIQQSELFNNKKEEKINFLKYYVKPHKKISRIVEESDLKTILKDGHIMYNLCYTQCGKYGGAKAIAHCQINDKDPLRFFITKDEKIVINPVITRHTRHTVDSLEGCLSYPDREMIVVQRWNKCEVKYLTLDDDGKKMIEVEESLSGTDAKVFQHELDHADGTTIYDIQN